MAVSGDFRVSSALGPYPSHRIRSSKHLHPPSKVHFGLFFNGSRPATVHSVRCHSRRSSSSMSQQFDSFLLHITHMGFFERLSLAWKVVFPPSPPARSSNANLAKQRLKMILFSDRCAVSDEAKQKIVSNIVSVLSDFVEIESQDKVHLSVSTDPDLGTVYSVSVPVRRVRSEYQEEDSDGVITNIEYRDNGDKSGSVDVKFGFYVPNDNA